MALATQTPVTTDSLSPVLEKNDAGAWTTSLGFTNWTSKQIKLTAGVSGPSATDCRVGLDNAALPAGTHSAVKVTLPTTCNVAKAGIKFSVFATSDANSKVVFAVTATPKAASPKPEWSALGAFPIALLALLIAAGIYFWKGCRKKNAEMKYLEATWSFKDSWVTNVTVAGGLLAGIFGSNDVVTALLGKDAKSSIALATVGAAVAAAIIAAGPLILLSSKSKENFVTVGGFLIAAAVTLAGATGELWVVYRSGRKLDLGHYWGFGIAGLAAAGFALVALYAVRAIPATIKHGTKAPHPPPPPSDTLVAAHLIVRALRAEENLEHLRPEEDAVPERPAASYPRIRRSGLL
jgi:uncharacterized membrane protein